ncbi:MAG: formylmethanofuran dehydrogenase subunit C [Planctomycetia bacterium]|nr:formylmethanofuran dehydrogenase subunit C [Planctomycetia bacterium]
MPLVLSLRVTGDRSPLSIDLDGIVPDRLASLAVPAIARLRILADGRPSELGTLFEVSGDAADAVIECRGDFARVHRVAAGMRSGTIRTTGPIGRHAAEGMTGGRLDVSGDAGDWLAVEMAGGEIHVAGNVGDNLAAALPGSPNGMRGGLVTVAGDAGSLAGSRMRRGIVAIAGRCGDAAGFEMRAGSVVIGGDLGREPGLGMRRGSVIALATRPEPPATFRRGAVWRPAFLPLLLRRLAAAGFRPAVAPPPPNGWRQWHGDTLAGSRGEILHPA